MSLLLLLLPLLLTKSKTSTSSAAQALTFANGVNYIMGSHPYSAVSFSRFGQPMFAVTNNSSGNVTVMQGNFVGGNYDGTFTLVNTYTVGNGPQAVAAGILQANEQPSLVVANSNSNSVSVLLGSGSPFLAAVSYQVGSFPESVTLGDLNNDGRLDIIAGNYAGDSVSVLLQNADHTFTSAGTTSVSSGPEFVVVGDFNSDGNLDVATCDSGNNPGPRINVLMGNGNGTLQAPVTYTVGNSPYTMATADFNGDGKLDFVTANHGANNVSVLLNNGNGTFAAKVDYGVGTAPFGVNTGDFNGDLKTDIIVTNQSSNNVSILLNNGNGTFQAAQNYPVGTAPFFAGVGDFNKDGKLDFVIANNGSDNATVRLNTSVPANDNFVDAITLTGATGFVTGTNRGATKEAGEPSHAGNAGGASVWYKWQPPANGSYTFTTYPSSFNTLLAVYTGATVNALTGVVSNDDDALSFCSANVSRITISNADATKTYYIAVDGFAGATGDVAVRWGKSSIITGTRNGGNRFDLTGSMCQRTTNSYLFSNIPTGGNYTIAITDTANLSAQFRQYGDPPSVLNPLLGDVTNYNFVQTSPTYSVSGLVRLANLNPVSGVGLTAVHDIGVDTNRNASSSGTGSYAIGSLWIGSSYTVTPSKSGFVFDPPYQVVSGNQTAINFTATPASTLSGKVVNVNGRGLFAIVNFTENNTGSFTYTYTDNDGNYSINLANGNYNVYATYSTDGGTNVGFLPDSQTINLTTNTTAQPFVANIPTFTVAGTVKNQNGVAISGATVRLTGTGFSPVTLTTAANGSYVSPPLHVTGDYTFTPQSYTTGGRTYNFSPVKRDYVSMDICATVPNASCSGFNYLGVDYVATVDTLPATAITSSGATLNGSVNPTNLETVVRFFWGTDPTLSLGTATQNQTIPAGNSIIPFSASLTGLTGNTTYYFQAVVFNTGGTVYGPILSFTTPAAQIQVMVQTNPVGRSFTVDGTSYSTTQTFSWIVGSSHSISTTTPQSGAAGTQYVWSNWSDSGAISHNVAPAVATTFTANFTTQYQLTMNAGSGGLVSPPSGFFDSGQSVQITATPNAGFSFSSWTGSGSGSFTGVTNPVNVTMSGPITETASFIQNPVSITVQTNPTGRSFSVDGTNYSSTQTFNWAPGSNHIIATTSPQSGAAGTQYVWSSWSDTGAISHNVAPTVATAYTANFTTQYMLTMSGAGGTVLPANGFFNSGQNVQISATPDGTHLFTGWTGSGTGSYSGAANPSSVTMNGPITETANFAAFSNVQFSASTYSVNEGAGSIDVTVTRTGDISGVATVDVSSSDIDAAQSSDYELVSSTLTFAAGQNSKPVTVLIVNDAIVEVNEKFSLTLSNPTNTSLGSPSGTTVTIIDNDTLTSTSPAARQFVAYLTGAAEVPARPNNVLGNGGVVQLNQAETSALVSLQFSGLTGSETGAHIHGPAAPGVNGPQLFTLPMGSPVVDFMIAPNAQQVADLKAGMHYMNVHSGGFVDGEIRGQLLWNPLEEAQVFVTQAYYDFLNRLPDQGGLDYWVSQIGQCKSNVQCLRDKRIDVSNAFFYEQEYQQTGTFTVRLYRAAFGNDQPFPISDNSNPTEAKKLPGYAVFAPDRARLDANNLALSQLALATAFAQRAAFITKYPANLNTAALFVDAILPRIQDSGVNLTSQRQALIDAYNAAGDGNAGRGVVLYRLVNDDLQGGNGGINNRLFIDAEYNRGFVLTQYFGYLRRDPDIGGFLFWIGQINSGPLRDGNKQHGMVCSFITSDEYQKRFGPTSSRNNGECQQ